MVALPIWKIGNATAKSHAAFKSTPSKNGKRSKTPGSLALPTQKGLIARFL
jgi:hypothetical protein